MSDQPPTLDQLGTELREAALQVYAAQERLEDRDFIASVHAFVDRLGSRYRDFLAAASPEDRTLAERALGRRVADIRRLASLLPRVPVNTASTPDRQVSGASAVGERRITGVSWTHDRAAPTTGLRVGGECEAWCGKCADMRTHHIVAIVGTEPKQVICQACNSRHTYRTGPARKRADNAARDAGSASGRRTVAVDPEAARRAQILRALSEEVAAATTVRSFDPKERYKAGEIIVHTEYGRGKVENVLRSSILVRFARSGLKPLTLH